MSHIRDVLPARMVRRSHPCIVPPYLLEQVIRNGSPEQREAALRTLSTDTTLRAARLGRGELVQAHRLPRSAPTTRPPWMRAVGATATRTIFDAEHGETLPGRKIRGP